MFKYSIEEITKPWFLNPYTKQKLYDATNKEDQDPAGRNHIDKLFSRHWIPPVVEEELRYKDLKKTKYYYNYRMLRVLKSLARMRRDGFKRGPIEAEKLKALGWWKELYKGEGEFDFQEEWDIPSQYEVDEPFSKNDGAHFTSTPEQGSVPPQEETIPPERPNVRDADFTEKPEGEVVSTILSEEDDDDLKSRDLALYEKLQTHAYIEHQVEKRVKQRTADLVQARDTAERSAETAENAASQVSRTNDILVKRNNELEKEKDDLENEKRILEAEIGAREAASIKPTIEEEGSEHSKDSIEEVLSDQHNHDSQHHPDHAHYHEASTPPEQPHSPVHSEESHNSNVDFQAN